MTRRTSLELELSKARPKNAADFGQFGNAAAMRNAVCRECATAAGYVPKDKVVGVWMDTCGICHEMKPCTDLHHDWRRKKEGGDK